MKKYQTTLNLKFLSLGISVFLHRSSPPPGSTPLLQLRRPPAPAAAPSPAAFLRSNREPKLVCNSLAVRHSLQPPATPGLRAARAPPRTDQQQRRPCSSSSCLSLPAPRFRHWSSGSGQLTSVRAPPRTDQQQQHRSLCSSSCLSLPAPRFRHWSFGSGQLTSARAPSRTDQQQQPVLLPARAPPVLLFELIKIVNRQRN